MTPLRLMLDWSNRPFRYGEDCCQFAASFIEMRTGHNPMVDFIYSNKKEALALIAKYGSLEDAITETLGEPIPVTEAKELDVLLADTDNGPAAGILYNGRCVIRTPTGLMDWPLEFARLAWSS